MAKRQMIAVYKMTVYVGRKVDDAELDRLVDEVDDAVNKVTDALRDSLKEVDPQLTLEV